jgi:thioredoxin 1
VERDLRRRPLSEEPNVDSGSPSVVEATPEEFDELLGSASDALVVLYMWGPDCPNCEVFARRLPHLLEGLAGVNVHFVKVDVYTHPELARRYGVYGIPHFVLFREGRRLGRMSQFRGDAFFTQVIREHLAPGGP